MKISFRISVLLWPLWLFSCATPNSSIGHSSEGISPSILSSWVELGPGSQIIARAIVSTAPCPMLLLDAREEKMVARGQVSDKFPTLVCEKQIPEGTASAKIGSANLPLPKKDGKRILVIGDTGCRVKKNQKSQDCNDPKAWPFKQVAQKGAEWKPDLVIHVGDYLYRESSCPAGNKGCLGSPSGDSWETWNADFFTPARELLQAAPWVFVRGNHEICQRAGQGWFRYLDPRSFQEECSNFTDPYTVGFPSGGAGIKMSVLDSAIAEDMRVVENQVGPYAEQFQKIKDETVPVDWILTHHPVWAFTGDWKTKGPPKAVPLNATLQKASEGRLAKELTLVLSGHVHSFEVLNFADSGPSQLVLGNGGTDLNDVPEVLENLKIGGRDTRKGFAVHEFGYFGMELQPGGRWLGTAFDSSGSLLKSCRIQGASVDCKANTSSD